MARDPRNALILAVLAVLAVVGAAMIKVTP